MDIEKVALDLRSARESKIPIAPLSERLGLKDPKVAYDIQAINTDYYIANGRRVVGCKIGLTSEAVQKQLGVDEPDFGILWGDQAYKDSDEIDIEQYLQPRVEAEIAFVLNKPIVDPNISYTELLNCIEYVLPAVEIVDSAIADWKIKLVDTIADNASAAGFVLGSSPKSLKDLDLRLCGMLLQKNGMEASIGLGAACMGHPINATTWLAKKMIEVGRPLQTGDIVLSGALGPMVNVVSGDHLFIEIQGFSPFSVRFK